MLKSLLPSAEAWDELEIQRAEKASVWINFLESLCSVSCSRWDMSPSICFWLLGFLRRWHRKRFFIFLDLSYTQLFESVQVQSISPDRRMSDSKHMMWISCFILRSFPLFPLVSFSFSHSCCLHLQTFVSVIMKPPHSLCFILWNSLKSVIWDPCSYVPCWRIWSSTHPTHVMFCCCSLDVIEQLLLLVGLWTLTCWAIRDSFIKKNLDLCQPWCDEREELTVFECVFMSLTLLSYCEFSSIHSGCIHFFFLM